MVQQKPLNTKLRTEGKHAERVSYPAARPSAAVSSHCQALEGQSETWAADSSDSSSSVHGRRRRAVGHHLSP